uniref:Uncharacterized protein n=1 Tax=Scylla olivacea TaxID=85551 RepID=A0A0P4W9B1_SCYOL
MSTRRAARGREEVFGLHGGTSQGTRTRWVLPVVRCGMLLLLAGYTAWRALTHWGRVVVAYQLDASLALEPLYYLALCVASLAALCRFVLAEEQAVRATDAEERPDEAVLWEWCVPCGVLRPPDASHCWCCQRCIRGKLYHRVSEFKCVSGSNVNTFLCLVVAELLSQCENVLQGNVLGSLFFFFDFLGLLRVLWHACPIWGAAKKPRYSKEVFQVCRSSKLGVKEAGSGLSFSAQEGAMCASFCPAGEEGGGYEATRRRATTCPNPRCNTVSNKFWATGDAGGIVECNICQATFSLPEEEARQAEAAPPDEEWLVIEGDAKPRLVFLLDTPLARTCRALIDKWVREARPAMDVDVVTPAEGCAGQYRQASLTLERYSEGLKGHLALDNALGQVAQILSCQGGRMVFVRQSSCPLESTTLVALGRVARCVPLEYISVAPADHALPLPDLWPGLVQQIHRGGGTFRRVTSPASLARCLRLRELVPWGVHASMQVITSPGLHVAGVSCAGTGQSVMGRDATFRMAALSEATSLLLHVRVDAESMGAARRLSEPRDSRVFLQLQLTYTRLDGRVMRRLYNRAFLVTGGKAASTLAPLP